MTVQVLLAELGNARESLDRALACVSPSLTTFEAPKREQPTSPAPLNSPIKFVTENGFVIERVCEREKSITDSASECHFVVRGPDDKEHRVTVTFGEAAIRLVQSLQLRNPLSLKSPFWLRFAESHLANYLWQENDYPPAGWLTIAQLSEEDLRQGISL